MKKTSTILVTSIMVASSLLITACSDSDNPAPAVNATTGGTFDARALIDNIADNIITKTYFDLDEAAQAFLASVEALDADTATDTEMDAAQQAWIATRIPWEASEGHLFGPVDSLGVDPAIDSWPLNISDLTTFLATNPNQAAVESAGDEVRGFHAMEYLLFGDGATDNQKSASELTDDESSYLIALAQAFKVQTNLLATSWTTSFNGGDSFSNILKSQGAGQAFASQGAVLEELINAMTGIADEVGNAKIAEPFGANIGAADAS